MADATWDEFRRTVVHLSTPSGRIEVAPAATGVRGPFLEGARGPLHLLTAWNPQGRLVDEAQNRAAGDALAAELAALPGVVTWPTTGTAPDAAWQEEGVTVQGLSRAAAIELAIRFDQRAIFEWADAPGGFRLIACDGSADEPRGWQLRRLDA